MDYTNENKEQEQPEQPFDQQKGNRNKKKRGAQPEQESTEEETPDYMDEEQNEEVEGGHEYEGAEDEEVEEEESEDESEEDEEGYEDASPKGQRRPSQVEAIAKRVVKYVDEQTQNMDTKSLAKYAAVGVLLFAGMRKSGFLGSLAVSVAAGIITKHIAENASDLLNDLSPNEASGD